MLLARHFAAQMARELDREEIPEFSAAARAALEAYPWPGNVRELKNVVERAVYRSNSQVIAEIIFDPFAPFNVRAPVAGNGSKKASAEERGAGADLPAVPMKRAVQDLQMRMLESALERSRYNQRKAAALLGLTYDQFRGLYRRYASSL
jgi:psp operon transcriptional activator